MSTAWITRSLQQKSGRTKRCTEVADRPFPDGKFTCRDIGDRQRSCDLSQPIHLFYGLAAEEKTDSQHGLCSCKSWPRRHEADGGQEELDGRWVSLPSGSSRRRRNLQLQSIRSCPRIGFRRTRTQSAAADGTQCNGTHTRWLFELRRCRSLIEAVRGNLRTNRPDSYTRSKRVRVRVPRC